MSKLNEILAGLEEALFNVQEQQFALQLEADSMLELSKEARAFEHEHYGPCAECERLYDDLLNTKGLLALEIEEKSLRGSIRLIKALKEEEAGNA